MGKRKKEMKKEPLVIDPRELAVTELGKLERKENGPIFAIVWIVIFVVGIAILPYLSEYFSSPEIPSKPIISNPSGNQGSSGGTTNPEDEFIKESEYNSLATNTAIVMNGVKIENIVLDLNEAQISLSINPNKVDQAIFQKYNFYLELYTDTKTLLQRIRLTDSVIKTTKSYVFDLDTSQDIFQISHFRIVLKSSEDYPSVELSTDASNKPILQCQNDHETILYTFEEKDGKYQLIALEESFEYYEDELDYLQTYNKYISYSTTYNEMAGVTTYISTLSNGFYYQMAIDLTKVIEMNYQKLFTRPIYYAKGTEAKIINFELNASGYKCN